MGRLERGTNHLLYCGLSASRAGDHTAGPRLRFSSLNCRPVASIARPSIRPRIDLSTRCPFAFPPIRPFARHVADGFSRSVHSRRGIRAARRISGFDPGVASTDYYDI